MARVLIEDIDVMFVAALGGPTGGRAAFDVLEAALTSLRGRRFYGTYLGGEYRACVAVQPGDDPRALGLDTWRIPGGAYERRAMGDWESRIAEVGAIFGEMAEASDHDASRPSIEFYRSARELVLLLPVR